MRSSVPRDDTDQMMDGFGTSTRATSASAVASPLPAAVRAATWGLALIASLKVNRYLRTHNAWSTIS